MVYTPFDAGGEIDQVSLQRLVAHLIEAGAAGLAMTGQASETAWLSDQERRQLMAWTAAAVDGQVPLIAGVNAGDIAGAIAAARQAAACGAQAVFSGPPQDGTTTGSALRTHFRALADASPVPVMLQDSPRGPLSLDDIGTAAEHPNVRYVKEESARAGPMVTAIRGRWPDLMIYTGGKNPLADLARGARGGIPGSVGVADLAACDAAVRAGDLREARRRHLHIAPLLYAMSANPLAWAKEILRRLGVIADAGTRSPDAPRLDALERDEVEAVMGAIGPPF